MDREQWLTSAIERLRPLFNAYRLPEKIRASCSWPSRKALAKRRRVGEVWEGDNNVFEIFISPVLADSVTVAAVLVHELVHCAVGFKFGHRGPFAKCARALGLEGKLTETTAGERLKARLNEVINELGPYPHAELKHSNAMPKQSTRMLLVKCPRCGYQVRTTLKWLEVGTPTCPCGVEMVAV